VGEPADFVLFELDRPWRISVEAFRSKCKNSPYDGRPVQGRVLRTVLGGRDVFVAEH
jgi:dihydroorotase